MPEQCGLCGGAKDRQPKGWKPDIPEDRWSCLSKVLTGSLGFLGLCALTTAAVALRPSVIGWSGFDERIAANWGQVFITALAGMAAGIAGFMAIWHVDQARSTNQLSALIQVWEMVNEEKIAKGRRKLYETLAPNETYRHPENWGKLRVELDAESDMDLPSLIELVAYPLNFTGCMVVDGLLSPKVVASAWGEPFIRTYSVVQHWVEGERGSHRSKSLMKALEHTALWAVVNDQDHRESFKHGHEIKFVLRDGTEAGPICVWETATGKSSAAG